MPYVMKWQASICWEGQGVSGMTVPSAQVLTLGYNSTGGGGIIAIPSTGAYPLAANITTACTTMGTNAAAAFEAAAQLAQIQGFASGGG